MKVAVFHNMIKEWGGAENLAYYLAKALNTKVYTIFDENSDVAKKIPKNFVNILEKERIPVISHILGKLSQGFEYLYWSNIDVTDFGEFDAIVTSGWFTRSLIVPEWVMHVHYNHTPVRWIYDLWHHSRKRKRSFLKKEIIHPIISEFFRVWDKAIDSRVDYYFSNSPVTKQRLWKYLKRDSVVLYPPIEFKKYKFKNFDNFYLFIGRLWPEKRPEEAILGCIKANREVVVVGTGSLERYLREKYGKHPLVEIRGFVSEEEKIDLLSRCKAVIYPCLAEDFGIVPIEAFASGKPVIADKTGFPPYVVNEDRGIVTDCSKPENIAKAIELLERKEYNPDKIREFAKQFDFENFRKKLRKQLKIWYEEFNSR